MTEFFRPGSGRQAAPGNLPRDFESDPERRLSQWPKFGRPPRSALLAKTVAPFGSKQRSLTLLQPRTHGAKQHRIGEIRFS